MAPHHPRSPGALPLRLALRHLPAVWVASLALGAVLGLGACLGAVDSEGDPSTPVTLVVGETRSSSVAGRGTSYYHFVAAGSITHTIRLTLTSSNLSWTLYSGSDFASGTIATCNTVAPGPGDEICTTSLVQGVHYYLAVREWDGVAGTFDLLVSVP